MPKKSMSTAEAVEYYADMEKRANIKALLTADAEERARLKKKAEKAREMRQKMWSFMTRKSDNKPYSNASYAGKRVCVEYRGI